MDQRRFLEIYHATVGPLYGSVAGWTNGDRTLSEDIVQETFLRAVRTWPRRGEPDNPLAWLRTVARNALTSAARAKRPEPDNARVAEAVAPAGEDPADQVALATGIETLENGHARILRAFHLEGQSMREIAAIEGISERAVEGRLRRARAALRDQMTLSETPETVQ